MDNKMAVMPVGKLMLKMGLPIIISMMLQALDKGLSSLIILLLRQLVLVLPVAWLFSGFVNGDLSNAWLIWLTFPVAELITAAVAVLLMKPAYKKTVKTL